MRILAPAIDQDAPASKPGVWVLGDLRVFDYAGFNEYLGYFKKM